MILTIDRHGDLSRTQIPSGRGALTRRCRARRVRGGSVSDRFAAQLACEAADGFSWCRHTPSGLEIVPGGDERSALLSISPASAGGRTRQILATDMPRPEVVSPRTVFGRRSPSVVRGGSIYEADHEARGSAEIVSKGRPQAVYNANRIARANKLGAALAHARRRTCDAASSACNTGHSAWRSRGAKFANLHAVGRCCSTFRRVFGSGDRIGRGIAAAERDEIAALARPADLPCVATVRSPWAGSEKRPGYFSGEDMP